MKISVLITGKIRNKYIFKYLLSNYILLRDHGIVDEIIISGWEADYESEAIDINELSLQGIKHILTHEPNAFYSPGHLIHQLKAIKQALPHINPENFIFKTRTDIVPEFEKLPALFSNVINARPIYGTHNTFRRRIWVTHFEFFVPFWISDLVIMAQWTDMESMIRYDFEYEIMGDIPSKGAVPNPEIRHFLPIFEQPFPLLREYRKVWPLMHINNSNYCRDLINFLEKDIYLEYLSLYYYIIDTHFLVGTDAYPGEMRLLRKSGENWYLQNAYPASSHDDSTNFSEKINKLSQGNIFSPTPNSKLIRSILNREDLNSIALSLTAKHLSSALAYKNTSKRMSDLLSIF